MKAAIAIVLALSTCCAFAKGSSSGSDTALPRGACLWQVPNTEQYINLYAVQHIVVRKQAFEDNRYYTEIRFGYGSHVNIDIQAGVNVNVHTRAMLARLAECQN